MRKENLLIGIVVVLTGILGITGIGGKSIGTDFASYYVSASIVRFEGAEKIYNIATFDKWRKKLGLPCGIYRYPPVWAMIVVPYTFLPFKVALLIHQVILTIFLFFFWKILFNLPFYQNNKIKYFTLFASLMFSGTVASIRVGQIDIIIAFLYIFSLYLILRNNKLSPVFLSLSAIIKVTPGSAIIEFIKNKRFDFLIYFTITILVIIVLSIILAGLSPWLGYIKSLNIISKSNIPSSLTTTFSKVSSKLYNIWWLIPILAIIVIWTKLTKNIIYNWALLSWVIFLSTPITNPSYYIFTLFPFYYFIQMNTSRKNTAVVCILFAAFIIANLRNPFYTGNLIKPWMVVIAIIITLFSKREE